MLAPFLSPLPAKLKHSGSSATNAIFRHQLPVGDVHAQWWSPKQRGSSPEVVYLFVPGNPGLVEFYTPFLENIYQSGPSDRLAILAHAHAGHTPLPLHSQHPSDAGLAIQIESAIEAFDAVRAEYPSARIVAAGHSVGAYIVKQVLKARRDAVSAVFLLFPTISHIAGTPNGQRLKIIFKPITRQLLSYCGYMAKLLPIRLLAFLYRAWPVNQLAVLKDLISSPSCITAALVMASDEMKTIKGLDTELLEEFKHKLHFYYASHDDWVGDERDELIKALHPGGANIPLKVVHGEQGIPHAFCISRYSLFLISYLADAA
ncbi:hypothetical protein BKA70DRAFT_1250904 [Coprinopsis sp. MPI-PUGE-AT-0042]|nr:hypothetical protein BKA70DRAFT_1250904 [Coprinopsis sp. MPI-PUGE-AT-0042]